MCIGSRQASSSGDQPFVGKPAEVGAVWTVASSVLSVGGLAKSGGKGCLLAAGVGQRPKNRGLGGVGRKEWLRLCRSELDRLLLERHCRDRDNPLEVLTDADSCSTAARISSCCHLETSRVRLRLVLALGALGFPSRVSPGWFLPAASIASGNPRVC